MPSLQFQNGGSITVDKVPDTCPICHSKITVTALWGLVGSKAFDANSESIFHCPNQDCGGLFIAYYDAENKTMGLFRGCRPGKFTAPVFLESIKTISKAYCDIYSQAHSAEEQGLLLICGVGYRKALEFLIKDYLIGKRPEDCDAIQRAQLGTCINNYVEDVRIKEIARRAVWLGNDETHYLRVWAEKDLQDLKLLIRLVTHWIETEHLTDEALKSMSPPPK